MSDQNKNTHLFAMLGDALMRSWGVGTTADVDALLRSSDRVDQIAFLMAAAVKYLRQISLQLDDLTEIVHELNPEYRRTKQREEDEERREQEQIELEWQLYRRVMRRRRKFARVYFPGMERVPYLGAAVLGALERALSLPTREGRHLRLQQLRRMRDSPDTKYRDFTGIGAHTEQRIIEEVERLNKLAAIREEVEQGQQS